MIRFRRSSGISEYIRVISLHISVNYILYNFISAIKMGRFRFGGRLRGLNIEISY